LSFLEQARTSLIELKTKQKDIGEAEEIIDFLAIILSTYAIIFSIFYALWIDYYGTFSMKAMIMFMIAVGGLFIRNIIKPFIQSKYLIEVDTKYLSETFNQTMIFLGIAGSLIFLVSINQISQMVGATTMLFAQQKMNIRSPITIVIFYTSIATAEEFFFIHLYILGRIIMRKFSLRIVHANILVGALWVLFHRVVYGMDFQIMIILLIARTIFNLSYEFTKKLSVPMMCHLSWNFLQSLRMVIGI